MELFGVSGWAFEASSIELFRHGLGVEGNSIAAHSLFFSGDPVENLVSVLPSSKVRLLSWSLGGMLSLEAARRYPERFESLVLLGVAACFTRRADNRRGIPEAILASMRSQLTENPAKVVAEFAKNMLGENTSIPKPVSEEELTLPEVVQALDRGLAYLASFDIRPYLSQISLPVLLIHGDADTIVPLAANDSLASGLPRVERIIVAGGGHYVFQPSSAREELLKSIATFLRQRAGEV